MWKVRFAAALISACLGLAAGGAETPHEPGTSPMRIIGHRGSPAYGAENTILGFRRAIELGADGVELDLVLTADDRLAVIHDWELNRLVGVEQLDERFPERAKVIEGERTWLTRDFTLDELRSLTVTQMGPRAGEYSQDLDDPSRRISGYADVLEEFARLRADHPGIVLYTEIKTSGEHLSESDIELMAKLVVDALVETSEVDHPESHWIQSFDGKLMELIASDSRLAGHTKSLLLSCEPGLIAGANPVILDVGTIQTDAELRAFLEEHVTGHGFTVVHGWKLMWWELMSAKGIDCAGVAHDLGLQIHAFTFRDEKYASDYVKNPDLAPKGAEFSSAEQEIETFRARGFDAIMSDSIDTALVNEPRP